MTVNVQDAGITRDVAGLKIVLQDETTGQSRTLDYDPKTMIARAVVDTAHRYTVAIDAPNYTPYRKYIAKVVSGQELNVALRQKPAEEPKDQSKYLFIVIDKVQRSVIPDAMVWIAGTDKKMEPIVMEKGRSTVLLPDDQDYAYQATAKEYYPASGPVQRSKTGSLKNKTIEIGMLRRQGPPQSQTIAFIAKDAFTKKPIAARFRFNSAQTNNSATITTAENPEFGTELKLEQSYRLEVQSNGYQDYTQTIELHALEAEPVKPRVVLLNPLAYAVTFVVLDAKTLKPIPNYSFTIREAKQDLKEQAEGNAVKVMLSPGKNYDIRVDKAGYERFDRSLSFEVPTSPTVLQKSILLSPVKAAPAAPVSTKPEPTPTTAPESVTGADEAVFENLKVGETMRLDNVYFDQSSYILRPESYPQLDKLVKTLKVNPKLKIEIAGHTDNVGDARLNQYLSENRTKVISSYLTNKGIPESRLVWKGYGETKPVASNDTEENKAQNRRVEFVVLEN